MGMMVRTGKEKHRGCAGEIQGECKREGVWETVRERLIAFMENYQSHTVSNNELTTSNT